MFTLRPVGVQPGLRQLRLPTGRLVDLPVEDLGQVLIDERTRVTADGPPWLAGLLKGVSNALCYGGLARADPHTDKTPGVTTGHAPGGQQLTVSTRFPESPGPHQFLPTAATVCAGARFIMSLARRAIESRGGVVAAIHADSLAVPCTPTAGWASLPDGTRLRLLSEPELRTAIDPLSRLGVRFGWEIPADPPTVGVVVGVNRVVFARQLDDGTFQVVRSSDSGLGGHLADPSDQPGARQADGRWPGRRNWKPRCFPPTAAPTRIEVSRSTPPGFPTGPAAPGRASLDRDYRAPRPPPPPLHGDALWRHPSLRDVHLE